MKKQELLVAKNIMESQLKKTDLNNKFLEKYLKKYNSFMNSALVKGIEDKKIDQFNIQLTRNAICGYLIINFLINSREEHEILKFGFDEFLIDFENKNNEQFNLFLGHLKQSIKDIGTPNLFNYKKLKAKNEL